MHDTTHKTRITCTGCGRVTTINSGGVYDCPCGCKVAVAEPVTGLKYDDEKPRMDLLPFEALEEVAKVLTFGAKKYAANNWQKVDHAESRYIAALLRHISAHLKGEKKDSESELSHLSHVATNALFLLWFEIQKDKEKENENRKRNI